MSFLFSDSPSSLTQSSSLKANTISQPINPIIDMNRYNGRINLLDNTDPSIRIKMYEKIALKNKATEYRGSLEGILEDNLLAQVFFSQGNIQILQNGLRAGVYRMSKEKKIVVPPQNMDSLKTIMRSMYLQYAEHSSENVTKQVEKLNDIVLKWVIPSVYNESISYLKYLEDQSTLVRPLDLPKLNDRDYKQLELKKWF